MNTTAVISGDFMRRSVKAAITAAAKQAAIPSLETICFSLDREAVTVESSDLEQGIKAIIPAKVEGYADFVLHNDEAKRLLNIKGGAITIHYNECGEQADIMFSDGKKKLSFKKRIFDKSKDWISFGADSYEQYAEFEAESFMEAVKRCAVFKAANDTQPILQGFAFDGDYLETLDGLRAFLTKMSGTFYNSEKFAVCGKLENVKTMFDKSETLVFEKAAKYVKLSTDNGIHLDYILRIIQGEIFPLRKNCIPKQFVARMTIEAETLKTICKEAKSYVKGSAPMPIVFKAENGKGRITLAYPDFRYDETFEAESYEGAEMYAGYKAAYMLDGLNAFKGEIDINFSGTLTPMVISQGDDMAIVLPVRLSPETKQATA